MATLAEIVTTYANGVPYPASAHNNEMLYVVQGLAGVTAGQMPYMAGLRDPALTAAPTANGQVPTWDSANAQVVWADQAGGGGITSMDTSSIYRTSNAGLAGQLVVYADPSGNAGWLNVSQTASAAEFFPPHGILTANATNGSAASVLLRGLHTMIYTPTNPSEGDRVYAVRSGSGAAASWALTTTTPTTVGTRYAEVGFVARIVNATNNQYEFYFDFSAEELVIPGPGLLVGDTAVYSGNISVGSAFRWYAVGTVDIPENQVWTVRADDSTYQGATYGMLATNDLRALTAQSAGNTLGIGDADAALNLGSHQSPQGIGFGRTSGNNLLMFAYSNAFDPAPLRIRRVF